jgi:hypothetical protein
MQKAATWPLFEKRLLGGNLEEAMQGTIPLSGTYLELMQFDFQNRPCLFFASRTSLKYLLTAAILMIFGIHGCKEKTPQLQKQWYGDAHR